MIELDPNQCYNEVCYKSTALYFDISMGENSKFPKS